MNLLHGCCRIGIALAATAWLSIAAAEVEVEEEVEAPDYALEKINYAADHCLQYRRWLEGEQLPTDVDDAEAMIAARKAAAANAAVDSNGHDTAKAGAGGEAGHSAEDEDAPELLLSSRFNGEACDAREDGAVIEDKAELPFFIDAVRAVHQALVVAPEWIDEEKLPLELQGCWRKDAKLDGAGIDREQNRIELYLAVADCQGDGRDLRLLLPLPLPRPGARSDYRRDKAIVAEQRIWAVCGTGLLEAAEASEAKAGKEADQ